MLFGEARLSYDIPKDKCELIFLKKVAFTPINGTITVSPSLTVRTENEIPVNGKTEIKTLQEKETSTVLMSADNKDAIGLIKTDKVMRCEIMVYEINYKGIYISKKSADKAPPIHINAVKIVNYLNNKIDFLYHDRQKQLIEMYQETVSNECKL